MTTITATLAWILAEINLLMLILLGAAAFIYLRNKRRDTSAVSSLVKTIKESEPQQTEAIRDALVSQYSQDEGSAQETAKRLIKLKKRFYKTIINIYIDKQREAFAALDQHLDELIMSYRTQMPITEEQPPRAGEQAPAVEPPPQTAPAETGALSADIEELKRQNEQLRKDLTQAKQELESTITEYVSAYSGGAELGKARLESELGKIQQDKRKGILEEDHPSAEATENADTADDPGPAAPPAPSQEGAAPDDDSNELMSLSDALAENGFTEAPAEADQRETVPP